MDGSAIRAAITLVLFLGVGAVADADPPGPVQDPQAPAKRFRALLEQADLPAMREALVCARTYAESVPDTVDVDSAFLYQGLRITYSSPQFVPQGNNLPFPPGSIVPKVPGGVPIESRSALAITIPTPNMSSITAAREFAKQPHVIEVVPECHVRLALDPANCEPLPFTEDANAVHSMEGPYDLWGHRAVGFDWKTADGALPVSVAVLDSGIDCAHEDLRRAFGLAPNLANPVATPGKCSVCGPAAGYDYVDMDHDAGNCRVISTPAGPMLRYDGHGTHIAGTIAAQGDNEAGVVGIAPNARLQSYRILEADNSFGPVDNAARAISDAHQSGARVINMSVYGQANLQPLCSVLRKVTEGPTAAFVTVIAKHGSPYLAACRWDPDPPAVTAVERFFLGPDQQLFIAAGDEREDIIYAPGGAIWSTNSQGPGALAYVAERGSSSSAAYVAGAATQILGTRAFESCSAADVKDLLFCTARKLTPCAAADPIKLLDLKFVRSLGHQKFASCKDAIAKACPN